MFLQFFNKNPTSNNLSILIHTPQNYLNSNRLVKEPTPYNNHARATEKDVIGKQRYCWENIMKTWVDALFDEGGYFPSWSRAVYTRERCWKGPNLRTKNNMQLWKSVRYSKRKSVEWFHRRDVVMQFTFSRLNGWGQFWRSLVDVFCIYAYYRVSINDYPY